MKKIVILLSILLVVLFACFIPVTQQKTISIKAPFYNVYNQLNGSAKWIKWRPDLREIYAADSNKISIKNESRNSFVLKYAGQELDVKASAGVFDIFEQNGNKMLNYSYSVVPQKDQDKTSVTVYKKISAFSYVTELFKPAAMADTHINDLKHFMETDSLRYGFNIFRTKVPGSNVILITRTVLSKNMMPEVGKMSALLTEYFNIHKNVKHAGPLIAQFVPRGKDSIQIKAGFYIDNIAPDYKDALYTRMPKGNTLFAVIFNGKFNQRQAAYSALQQYFADHLWQSAILPFEFYLDNKLPLTDTSKVKVQINFTTYF